MFHFSEFKSMTQLQSQSQSQWGICIAPLTIMDSGAEHVRS